MSEEKEKQGLEPETQAQEQKPAEKKAGPAESRPDDEKKERPGSEKLKRGGAATLVSVLFIAIVVVLNILVGLLAQRFPSMNLDLTADKRNTLSEQALDIARGVDENVTIYLIGAEDSFRRDRLYSSYGLEYSQVANLADRLREANPRISVQFVDPDENPAFISSYAEESLTSGSVLVKGEKRYKSLYVDDLFSVTRNSTTYETETYSKADSALAAAIELVTLDKVPVLTLATGHGEMLSSSNMAAFLDLMESKNFQVETINILTDEIPAETEVLMLPTPSEDYTEEEVAKLRAFLDDETTPEDLTILVTCYGGQGEMPKLSAFLEEWGIRAQRGGVVETDSSRMFAANSAYVLVDTAEDNVVTANSYSNLVAPLSAPLTLVFDGNGQVSTRKLWVTADSAFVITQDMTEMPENPETASQIVAALGGALVRVDGKDHLRNVVVFGSSYVFMDNFINASAFGNRQYITDLMQYCTNTDESLVTVRSESVQTNVMDISASVGLVNLLGIGVFTVGLPLLILAAGLVIFLRRRHL